MFQFEQKCLNLDKVYLNLKLLYMIILKSSYSVYTKRNTLYLFTFLSTFLAWIFHNN